MSSSANYHVFISFRGEDTRLNFTSHLHAALQEKGIGTFIDGELNKGEDVWPKLASAIEHSDISIVVFSENYATSKWCLKELVKILECRNRVGQVVVPVFYNMDPSDVRKQTGSYAEAFAEHERYIGDDKSKLDEVSEWRAALTEASNISGWDSRHQDEFPFIQDILTDVWQKLCLKYPNEIEVDGIDEVCEGIESLLKKVSKIGIWGMGGIGKTTIAKVMFAKHFPKYDSVCFMANVREQSQKLGETYTRDKLLCDLLKEQVPSNFTGSPFIKKRLSDKKKFIVLDDVDNYLQLDTLCAELGDLGKDSKLIITTRNKHLLDGIVDEVYPVKKWDYAKSLKLFSLQAFKESNPPMGYEHFSERAVEYAAGNPLALKVLGSHFRSRSPNFWESELNKFENKKESFKEIENVLRESYNGLQESQQAIFLDIAFFFKDENKDYAIRILDACDFFASSGIQILEDKALITISESNTIQMHDLLQQMGMDIVRENLRKPGDFGRRSRLRGIEEVLDVLKKEGTDAVEGITLDLSPIKHLQLSADTFHLMTNLRFLRLYIPSVKRSEIVYQCTVLKALSTKLRYLEWNGFPFKSLPPTFEAEFLIWIFLPYSHVQELWQGEQALALPNLEAIDLSECKQLTKLPDLSKASKLKWVFLFGCESLCVIHPSLLSLDTLDTLILDGCKKLKSLKSDKHLSSLKTLSVNGCSSLQEYSVSSELIWRLDFREARVKTLHSLNISSSSKLRWLNLEGPRLENLGDELSCLTTLEELKISHCGQVINKKKLHMLFGGLVSLKVLHLKHCYRLYELPDNISTLSSLRELMLDRSSVESLPASIKHLQGLKILSLWKCKRLRFLPELPPFIEEFYAVNCTSLVTVPTLKTFALQMSNVHKYILFANGMKLNGSSLLSIMEDTEFTMLSAAFHNVLARLYRGYYHNSVEVSLPGSNVPRSFTYQTKGSSITIELPGPPSNLVGLIYSVVLSPSRGMKQRSFVIQCQCYETDGSKSGCKTPFYNMLELNSDHVFIWFHPCNHFHIIIAESKKKLRFEFYATTEDGKHDGLISIKECGVHLLCYTESKFHNFLKELDCELNLKLELGLKLGLALDIKQDRGNYFINRELLYALKEDNELVELDESLKLELESRRRALSMSIETKNNGIRTQIQNNT